MKNHDNFIINLKKQIEEIIEKIIETEKKIDINRHSFCYKIYHKLLGEKIAYSNILEILDDFLEQKGENNVI